MMKSAPVRFGAVAVALATLIQTPSIEAAPAISRFSPPSALFTFGDANPPYIARFLPGQRFDLQVTVRPDAGQTVSTVRFEVEGKQIQGNVTLSPATAPGL